MAESKPSHPYEGKKLNIPTDGNKGQPPNTNEYIGNKPLNKPSPDPEAEN